MITLTYFELGVACLSIAMLVVVLVLYFSRVYRNIFKGEVGKYNGIRFIDDTKIYRNIFKEGETIDVAPDEILEVTYITRGDKIKEAEIRKKKSKC